MTCRYAVKTGRRAVLVLWSCPVESRKYLSLLNPEMNHKSLPTRSALKPEQSSCRHRPHFEQSISVTRRSAVCPPARQKTTHSHFMPLLRSLLTRARSAATTTRLFLPSLLLVSSIQQSRSLWTMPFHTERTDGTITVSPKNEAEQSGLVIISHGLGDTAEGFADVAEVSAATVYDALYLF